MFFINWNVFVGINGFCLVVILIIEINLFVWECVYIYIDMYLKIENIIKGI